MHHLSTFGRIKSTDNHNSTGVTSDVSLTEKIKIEFELNLCKTDYII